MSVLVASLQAVFREPGARIYGLVQGAVRALTVLSSRLSPSRSCCPRAASPYPPCDGATARSLGVISVEILVRIATFRLQAPEENGLQAPSS